MDFDSTERLRTSNSRNFSRPFPSPLSTGALHTPTRLSNKTSFFSRLPLSASHGSMLRSATSHDDLATNRFIDFVSDTQPLATKTSYIDKTVWNDTRSSRSVPSSPGSLTSSQQEHRRRRKQQKRGPNAPVSSAHLCNSDLVTESAVHDFEPNIWQGLQQTSHTLNLDLLSLIELDRSTEQRKNQKQGIVQEEPCILPYKALTPLLTFRNLYTLQLTGMLRSYQPLIWATCWLNEHLATLHLEMALEPLINLSSDIPHTKIDLTWTLRSPIGEEQDLEYLGHHGTGALHEEFGDGEYLDTQAMKTAQSDVVNDTPNVNLRYLPIKKLVLLNFVVDAWPMVQWFDPKRLEEIVFKPGCIDAGFYLPFDMMHVNVRAPNPLAGVARAVKPGELKILELKKGKVVSRKNAMTSKEELGLKQHPLRHKISQIFSITRKSSLNRNKENKPVMVEQGIQNMENTFSELELRAAREGKEHA